VGSQVIAGLGAEPVGVHADGDPVEFDLFHAFSGTSRAVLLRHDLRQRECQVGPHRGGILNEAASIVLHGRGAFDLMPRALVVR
jgi:hypothetical protein